MGSYQIPGLEMTSEQSGLLETEICSDGLFKSGQNGITKIFKTKDSKVEFICFEDKTLAYVKSAMGYPAYYPVAKVKTELPITGLLMDLDGTTVHSEEFWIWIIQKSVQSILNRPSFELEDSDLPFVSGHSVSEHLSYCIKKYCPEASLEEARGFYFEHTHREMKKIMEGGGRLDAFTPTPGADEFLYKLKELNIRIALVTSGLYEKAYPEILSAFRTLKMGDPAEFFDCVITAGYPLKKGCCGTLGELEAKPHPWLYAEACTVGLGIPFEKRGQVIGLEDSGAGVCAVRLAGFTTVGLAGGNILQSGTKGLCHHYAEDFDEILHLIKEGGRL